MQIRQIALHYQPEDDRLLLRLHSSDAQAFAVWLTRRLCQRLWPHLVSVVQQQEVAQALRGGGAAAPSREASLAPEARTMLAESARQDALRHADFSQPYDAGGATQPLGPEPLLATRVQMTPQPDGQLRLSIRDARSRELTLNLAAPMASAVLELMRGALRKAQWNLALDLESPAANRDAPPRVLN